MRFSRLSAADRVALIAAAGLGVSLAVWLLYAIVEALMTGSPVLGTGLLMPPSGTAWGRLLAIVGILISTLLIQISYARHLDVANALALEKTRVREMYDNSPDRIVCMTPAGAVQYTNIGHPSSRTQDGVSGLSCHELLYGRDTPCEACKLDVVARHGTVAEFTEAEKTPDGTKRWFNKMLYPIRTIDGDTESVVEVARDVTDLHSAETALLHSHHELEARIAARTAELTESNLHLLGEIGARERMSEALRESEMRFRLLIDASPDMILLHSEGHVDLVNPAGVRMLGGTRDSDIVGLAFAKLWDDVPRLAGAHPGDGSAGSPQTRKLRRLDGTSLQVEMSETLVLLEGRIHIQCLVRDVSEAMLARETIRRMAYFDSITELPNRALFCNRLEKALASARRNRLVIAVAFADIDDFRKVNDRWGHSVGDQALRHFADRLQSLFRENDTVSRYGSDEFAVLAELKSPGEAVRFGERLQAGLRPPLRVDGNDIPITVSLGIAVAHGRIVSAEEIVRRADEALCHAKTTGSGAIKIAALGNDEGTVQAQA